ncbi:FUSC family protein [Anaerobacillus isosaccharinicus]|uniref:Aromatic acid exporter family protein n=1 Tax=Anaerobacillus isosaccharinicus TaxID=1532552 RepID=A0A1S2LGE8_9BACI|nr:aromatic acid exporter family protein [Anaerobacillus isosaccharinicus]MBA5587507.1 aromatic acid exporter family protein [Anaerobacillus isosaccharinicus]QOY34311.1 aromatic acid exporter family protein [Anaerobacillus isosaccharinicus]
MNPFKFVGRRILKTGIAVFITALVCIKLDLPVIFAVITAIVTTEPTAADSLKRGIIRLPAAAIGAGFALILDLLLGQGAITFALVSMLTILFCHHLKLDNVTLVATLTAVAMIPGSNESLISEFVLRLSGTSLGIIISTFVNFAVLPPKFGPLLVRKVNELYRDTATHLDDLICTIVKEKEYSITVTMRNLHQELDKAFQLCDYQESEWQYRKSNEIEERSFQFLQKKLNQLQKIIFHVGNLSHINLAKELSYDEKKLVLSSVKFIKNLCKNIFHTNKNKINYTHEQLYDLLKEEIQSNSTYSQKGAFLHELLAILECLSILQKATMEEQLFSENNKNYPAYIFANQIQYD